MTGISWTASSRLSLSGLTGWAPIERIDVPHNSGRALVRVECFPIDPAQDLLSLATLHGESLSAQQWRDSHLTAGAIAGSTDVLSRKAVWSDDEGNRIETVVRYVLAGGRLMVLTTITPEDDSELIGEADTIRGSVRIAEPIELTTQALPLRPGQADFSEVTRAWRHGTEPAAATEHVVTTDESFGAARHFGVAMLPGADTSGWDQFDESERELAAAVAWRSLRARGAEAGTDLAEALEIAASHDLIVMVSELRGQQSTSQWFAARVDRMVWLRPDGPGRTVLTCHPTADLADLILAGTREQDRDLTASAVYRSDGHIVGDETTWNSADDPQLIRESLSTLVNGAHVRSRS